jgi:hypothetical protein
MKSTKNLFKLYCCGEKLRYFGARGFTYVNMLSLCAPRRLALHPHQRTLRGFFLTAIIGNFEQLKES